MNGSSDEHQVTTFYSPDTDQIEQLRVILAAESDSVVTFDDARNIGTQLISLYECLARERNDEKGGYDERHG